MPPRRLWVLRPRRPFVRQKNHMAMARLIGAPFAVLPRAATGQSTGGRFYAYWRTRLPTFQGLSAVGSASSLTLMASHHA